MCLAQGHNAVTPVRLEPTALWSRVKHSTTEPLRSHFRTVTRYNIPVEKQTSLGTSLLKQLVKVNFDVTNTNAFICNNSEGMNIMIIYLHFQQAFNESLDFCNCS